MNVANAVLVGAAGVAVLGALAKVTTTAYRFAKRFEAALTVTAKEVRPNGGSSMRDAVTRIEGTLDRIDSRVDVLDGRLARVEAHAALGSRDPRTRTRATD